MKTIKRTHMETIEAETLKEFSERFNSAMDWVSRKTDKKEYVIDLAHREGYIVYEETIRIPEGYRDQLELHNMKVCCGQCEHFKTTKYSWGECPHCRGDLRKSDECCSKFFKAWEDGDCWLKEGEEEYVKIIDELGCASLRSAS